MTTLQNQKGFTLIELIMVIVVIGILAAVAIPKYTSLTKDADYATVTGMVGALNAAASAKFAYNRLCAETGNCTAVLMDSAADLGAQLDPAFSGTTDTYYPNWTIAANGDTFVYAGKSGTSWTCTLTDETTTNRGKVSLPAY